MTATTPPIGLTIAGSDSGGGAGIQADLTTMAALGVHGTCVITVVTMQNTVGVQGLHPLPAAVVEGQLASVLDDLPPVGVKCGLLGTPELIGLVADAVDRGLARPVVDPVLLATSGDALTLGDATDIVAAYREALLPRTRVLTPNPDEAAALLGGGAIDTVDDRRKAAAALLALGPDAVVVTGGTGGAVDDGAVNDGEAVDRVGDRVGDGEAAVDVLADADGIVEFDGPAVDTANDHGSGCTHSSAVAALLASGADVRAACRGAHDFVRERLTDSRAWRLGAGRGPIAHVVAPRP
jgi:hydroxymethylpyrimidine/phosphomethylpyrimidine kinase